jgi:hypothetical protein
MISRFGFRISKLGSKGIIANINNPQAVEALEHRHYHTSGDMRK